MRWFQTAVVLLCLAPYVQAGDWPQWLGPKRDGNSAETVNPWKDAPKVAWKQVVGSGHSVPVVSNGRVFVHARVPEKEQEELIALDAKSGEVLWRTAYDRPAYFSVLNTGPQGTPAVGGNRVFTYGVNGVLSCFEVEKGKQLWQVNAYQKLKAELPTYGVCCSPLVVGNRVLVSVGGKGSSVAAFDAEKGEIVWQAFDEPASTASPVLFPRAKGLPDAVFMTSSRLVAVNPLDGSLNWEFPLVFTPRGASPTPLVAGDLLVTSTMSNGTTVVRLNTAEDKVTAEQTWQEKELHGYFSTGVAGKDRLYQLTNRIKPTPDAALHCVDLKTGKEIWKQEGVGYFHAGLIRLGDGKLLILDDGGTLKLVDGTGDSYRELCKAKVCGGTFANPVLSNGRVYVRDGSEVLCVVVGE
jgi:outer membrane protein assembly factor BamB